MSRIKKQLTVITRTKEAWLESRDKFSALTKAYEEALAIALISASGEELGKTVKRYEQIEQFRCIVDETKESLEGEMCRAIERLEEVNADMGHVVEELNETDTNMRHVVEEVNEICNDIRNVCNKLNEINHCVRFVCIDRALHEMMQDGHRVHAELKYATKEEAAKSQEKATSYLGLTKPRRKKMGDLDAHRRRERRLQAMKKCLEESTVGEPRIKYATIWTELEEIWDKIMEHECEKAFVLRSSGEMFSDKPLETIDADIDKLEYWISVL
jgi:uncharacterized protein YoxC